MREPTEVVKAMGHRLQTLRQAAGMSQPQLAAVVGVPVSSLRNWEQGRVMPQLPAAWRLAQALGITLDDLAGDVFKDVPSKKGKGKGKKGKGAS